MDLSAESISQFALVGVLTASFLGSAHCIGMCGGISIAVSRSKIAHVFYQLGRLSGYLLLGALGGGIGSAFFHEGKVPFAFHVVSALFMSLFFFLLAYSLWTGRNPHLPGLQSVFHKPMSWAMRGSQSSQPFVPTFTVGLLTAFLPCGWLHTFVLAALLTGTPTRGALLLFVFWLGSVPALSSSSWIMEKMSRLLPGVKGKRVLACVFLIFGLVSVGGRFRHLVHPTQHSHPASSNANPEEHSCH